MFNFNKLSLGGDIGLFRASFHLPSFLVLYRFEIEFDNSGGWNPKILHKFLEGPLSSQNQRVPAKARESPVELQVPERSLPLLEPPGSRKFLVVPRVPMVP